jgi:putative transposase
MSGKYQNKYRIPSARLQTWDYGNNGSYFITICTHNREHYFGQVVNDEMQLNEIGKLVEQEWIKTTVLRPDMNLELGNFVVMPNHFHAILIIGGNEYNSGRTDAMHRVSTINAIRDSGDTDAIRDSDRTDAMHRVATTPAAANTAINNFGPQSKNLASIIRGFKSSVTTQVKKMGIDVDAMRRINRDATQGVPTIWQPRFHDHIIRDAGSFERIQNYIADNPKNWKEDKFSS